MHARGDQELAEHTDDRDPARRVGAAARSSRGLPPSAVTLGSVMADCRRARLSPKSIPDQAVEGRP